MMSVNNVKFKEHVNLEDLLKGWKDNGDTYGIDSPFDEFISVNKTTREISQYGYNAVVIDWHRQGLIEII